MPRAGSQSNKWLALKLAVVSAAGREDSADQDQFDVLMDCSQLGVGSLVNKLPVTQLEIHAMTSNGDGSSQGFDRPVGVDDFAPDVQSP